MSGYKNVKGNRNIAFIILNIFGQPGTHTERAKAMDKIAKGCALWKRRLSYRNKKQLERPWTEGGVF